VALFVTPPHVAEIVVVPAATAVTVTVACPDAFVTAFAATVATAVFEEPKVTVCPGLATPASVTVAVAVVVSPTPTDA
jgi:hypothetical protein